MSNDSLDCEYVGWGNLEQFQSRSLGKNEALIFSPPADSAPPLIQGFLDSIRTPEVRAKIPSHFSENDVAGVMVEMVRELPETLFQEWKIQSNNPATPVCAILRWSTP